MFTCTEVSLVRGSVGMGTPSLYHTHIYDFVYVKPTWEIRKTERLRLESLFCSYLFKQEISLFFFFVLTLYVLFYALCWLTDPTLTGIL